MIRAFFLSLGQLGDPKIAGVFLKSLAVTLLVLAALGTALWFAAEAAVTRFGGDDTMGQLAGAGAVIGALALGWLLFRVIAIAVMDVFADDVVIAVEAKHYPAALAEAKRVSIGRSISMGLGSAGRALLINLALVPLYLLLIVTGIGTPVLFFVVNGWLLGRDLSEMVAARHMPRTAMRGWRETTRVSRFVLGLVVTGLFVVPIVNLLAPVLGAAMATHLFHGRTRA